jgi:hypothetical protein
MGKYVEYSMGYISCHISVVAFLRQLKYGMKPRRNEDHEERKRSKLSSSLRGLRFFVVCGIVPRLATSI